MVETFQLCWLFAPFWGGERLRGEVNPLGVCCGTPTRSRDGSRKFGFTTEGSVGPTEGEMGWRGEGLDTTHDPNTTSQGTCHWEPKGSVPTKRPRDLPPFDLGTPVPREKPTLLIKGDNKTIVDWMNGHAKMKTKIGTVEKAPKLPARMVGPWAALTAAYHRLGYPHLS